MSRIQSWDWGRQGWPGLRQSRVHMPFTSELAEGGRAAVEAVGELPAWGLSKSWSLHLVGARPAGG